MFNNYGNLKNKKLSQILQSQKTATENVFKRKKIPFRSFEIINRSEEASNPIIAPDILTKYQWSVWRWGYDNLANDYIIPPDMDTNANIIGNSKDTTLVFDGNGYASNWGFYNVLLRVETEWGCWDTAMLTFEVDPLIDFEIPNVFTPAGKGKDGDGINDSFLKAEKLIGLESMEGVIYNRWGRKVTDLTYNVGGGYEGQWGCRGQ